MQMMKSDIFDINRGLFCFFSARVHDVATGAGVSRSPSRGMRKKYALKRARECVKNTH